MHLFKSTVYFYSFVPHYYFLFSMFCCKIHIGKAHLSAQPNLHITFRIEIWGQLLLLCGKNSHFVRSKGFLEDIRPAFFPSIFGISKKKKQTKRKKRLVSDWPISLSWENFSVFFFENTQHLFKMERRRTGRAPHK